MLIYVLIVRKKNNKPISNGLTLSNLFHMIVSQESIGKHFDLMLI